MLIFENKAWQISSESADSNYLNGTNEMQPKWVVSDNSEIAAKVMSIPYWEAIEDDNGSLIDIIPAERPIGDEERIIQLKSKLERIDGLAIRPLRAIAAGNDTEADRSKLEDLEEQAEIIRMELDKLEGKING